ncbi:MAG TPA: hypothetical protein VFA98_08700 [Thermoanaerobaculia bacterium]|nr:hypothetical protein [Thermoanaerobaculia bacterium]
MLSRRRFWGAAALLAAAVTSAPAFAEAGSFTVSPAGDRVRAGEIVPLSWTLDASAMGDRDEMELVLSLDDGATFPIRVVARLEAADGAVRWRVPALPTEHARLALRAGDEGAAESEAIVAVSEPFGIAASRLETLERLYAVAGEWRTRDALEGAPARSGDGNLAPEERTELAKRIREKSEPETSPVADAAPRGGQGHLVSPLPPVVFAARPAPPPRAPCPLRL